MAEQDSTGLDQSLTAEQLVSQADSDYLQPDQSQIEYPFPDFQIEQSGKLPEDILTTDQAIADLYTPSWLKAFVGFLRVYETSKTESPS